MRKIAICLAVASLLLPPHAVAAPSDAKAAARTRNVILFVGDTDAMTAMMTGATTREASIGVDASLERGQCDPSPAHRLASLVEQAKDAGLAAGIVTTARITSAVPAAVYAHVSDRDWEIDSRMPEAPLAAGCQDIARQLVAVDHRGGRDVVLGGGRLAFMRPDQVDPLQPDRHGVRADGVDLIARWQSQNPTGRYVWTAPQLGAVAGQAAGPLLGLFAPDGMAAPGGPAAVEQPSLSDMTLAAIAVLAKRPGGYVLVVDQGGLREARDRGDTAAALRLTAALSDAAATATKAASTDTLIVVAPDRAGEAPTYAHGPGVVRVRGRLEVGALYAVLREALGLGGL